MSKSNKDKISSTGFVGMTSTDSVNIFEMATILKITPSAVRQRVAAGTLPQPRYDGRGERTWLKSDLTTAGITAVVP